jgi:hypothetical protein
MVPDHLRHGDVFYVELLADQPRTEPAAYPVAADFDGQSAVEDRDDNEDKQGEKRPPGPALEAEYE